MGLVNALSNLSNSLFDDIACLARSLAMMIAVDRSNEMMVGGEVECRRSGGLVRRMEVMTKRGGPNECIKY